MSGERRWRLGLVGNPIAGSLSPALHEAALGALGWTGSYQRFEGEIAELERVIRNLRDGILDGVNVTVPLKEEAARRCDRLGEMARRLGAVNTLRLGEDGALTGDNTDVAGLHAAIAGWPGTAKQALVVGAGGAARAAIAALVERGVEEIRVWNRTPARLAALTREFGITAVSSAERAAADAEWVIQASSHGMGLQEGSAAFCEGVEFAKEVLTGARPEARLFDMVYRPRVTPWTVAAHALGFREAASGLAMLVGQARAAFELWTGVSVPKGAMEAAAAATLTPSG